MYNIYELYLFGKTSLSKIHGKIMTDPPIKLMPHNSVIGIQVIELI